jgi:hypothetical protein
VTPQEIIDNIEVDLVPREWDVIEVDPQEGRMVITAESEYGDTMVFALVIGDVEFVPGPPSKEDFEPDRIEPGEGESPW